MLSSLRLHCILTISMPAETMQVSFLRASKVPMDVSCVDQEKDTDRVNKEENKLLIARTLSLTTSKLS